MLRSGGFNALHLHVKEDTIPALQLYISQGFEPVKKVGEGGINIFMRKQLSSTVGKI